jgi:predicted RNA-binding Zn-ribbon protein involved in translation (DUF1610 family)
MIVRCGNCQVELEVAGPGEFACPACGTRNAVRDPNAGVGPLGGAVGGGLGPDMDLGGLKPPPSPEESNLTWLRCPSCRFKFVVGEGVDKAPCPSCDEEVPVSDENRA